MAGNRREEKDMGEAVGQREEKAREEKAKAGAKGKEARAACMSSICGPEASPIGAHGEEAAGVEVSTDQA